MLLILKALGTIMTISKHKKITFTNINLHKRFKSSFVITKILLILFPNSLDFKNKFVFSVTVRAAVDVKKGDELYSSYTYSLWPTLVRREYLKESKHFDCSCARCSDKAELETHCGSLKCQRCDNGVILSTDPLGNDFFYREIYKFSCFSEQNC